MPRPVARTLVLAAIAAWLCLGACSRPGEKRCTEVCEHYLDLYMEHEWAEKLSQASDDERAGLEAQKVEQREVMRKDAQRGFDTCVGRCNRRSRGSVADCIEAADTLEAAKSCDDDDGCNVSASEAPRSGSSRGVLALALIAFMALVAQRRRRRG